MFLGHWKMTDSSELVCREVVEKVGLKEKILNTV